MLVPVEKTIDITPKPKIPVGQYATVTIFMSIKLKAAIEVMPGKKGDSTVDTTPGGYQDGAFVERLGRSWYDHEGVTVFGVNTGASESKIEGQAKIKDGLEVSLSGTLKYANGEELKLKFTVVNVGKDWQVSAGQVQFDYTFKNWEIKGYLFEGVTLKGSVGAVASVKLEPNYVAIAASIGSTGGQVATAGRVIVGFITFDAIITFGFIANGVLVVAGGLHGIALGVEIRALSGKVRTATDALTAGFTAGVQGQATNPAGSMGQPGFDRGVAGYQVLCKQMLAKVPDAKEDEMKEAISSLLPKYHGAIDDTMHAVAQQIVWDSWASSQTGIMDDREELKWGWVAIFGKLPSHEPEYLKYYDK